jgi:hypothetical protein
MITASDLYFALSDESGRLFQKMESLRPRIGQKENLNPKKQEREFKKAQKEWRQASLAASMAYDMINKLRERELVSS